MIGFAQSVAILFFARVLDGVTGGNIVVAQAYVTDIMPDGRRTQALGFVMAAFGLGFIVGPALGGLLASQFGPQAPFVLAAIAAFATVVLTYFTLEETITPEVRVRNRASARANLGPAVLMRNVPLLAAMLVSFLGRFGFGLMIGTFALFAEAVIFAGENFAAVSLGVGMLLMIVGIGQFFTQIVLLPAALRRYGDSAIVLIGSAWRAFGMFALALATEPFLAALSMIGFAIGSGLLLPALQSLVTKTVAREMRGAILGIHESVMSLAVIIATALSGSLFALDPAIPNWIGGILICLALLPGGFLLFWARRNGAGESPGLAVTA